MVVYGTKQEVGVFLSVQKISEFSEYGWWENGNYDRIHLSLFRWRKWWLMGNDKKVTGIKQKQFFPP